MPSLAGGLMLRGPGARVSACPVVHGVVQECTRAGYTGTTRTSSMDSVLGTRLTSVLDLGLGTRLTSVLDLGHWYPDTVSHSL